MFYAEKYLVKCPNEYARPKAGSSKSAEIMKNHVFPTKNETSQNGSPVFQDHSGHAYRPGNDLSDRLRPPERPPVAHEDGWVPRVRMSVEWQSIKTFVEKPRIFLIFVDFATLSLATHVSLRVRTRLRESQEVYQRSEAAVAIVSRHVRMP